MPTDGISRRDFFSLSALLAGGVAIGALLAAPGAASTTAAEAATVTAELGEWLTAAAHQQEIQPGYWPEFDNPFDQFFDRADELFRSSPRLGTLTFDNLRAQTVGNRLDAGRLAACPLLARVDTLILLGCFLEPDDLRVLLASSHLVGLRRLVVWQDDVGDDGAWAIAASPAAGGLRELSLNGNRIGPAGSQALAASDRLGRLESLDLVCNPIGDAGVRALAGSGRLPALRSLQLADNGIGPAGARALATARHLARLTTLTLAHQKIGPEAAAILRARFGNVAWVDEEDDLAAEAGVAAEEAVFLRAAVARADDDAPRLAYADWLAGREAPRRSSSACKSSRPRRPNTTGGGPSGRSSRRTSSRRTVRPGWRRRPRPSRECGGGTRARRSQTCWQPTTRGSRSITSAAAWWNTSRRARGRSPGTPPTSCGRPRRFGRPALS